MTDEQLKALLTELVAIRADVATKADLLTLEEGLIVGLARSIGNLPKAAPDDNPLRKELTAWMEVKDAELSRLTNRVNTWVNQLNDRLGRMSGQIENLNSRIDNLLTRIEALEARIAK